MISFLTGGYLAGIMLFEFSRKREYYVFYNLGISKIRLFAVTYLFNVFVLTVILIIAYYAGLFVS
jgi:hypothetical protein